MMKSIPILCLVLIASAVFGQAPTRESLNTALKANPNNRNALYNLGMLNYLSGSPEEAIAPWVRLEDLEPQDWKLKAKIIQAYSASGQIEERDKRIAQLHELRSSGKYPDLSAAKFFIRDQFQAGGFQVFVFDYYDMDAGWRMGPIALRFYLRKDGEEADRFLSLGSYESTTQIARDLGEIGENDRVFHLDGYWQDGRHATYGMYNNEPNYDLIRAKVVEILEGNAIPQSSSGPAPHSEES